MWRWTKKSCSHFIRWYAEQFFLTHFWMCIAIKKSLLPFLSREYFIIDWVTKFVWLLYKTCIWVLNVESKIPSVIFLYRYRNIYKGVRGDQRTFTISCTHSVLHHVWDLIFWILVLWLFVSKYAFFRELNLWQFLIKNNVSRIRLLFYLMGW